MYRLEKNFCKPQTFQEADDNRAYWLIRPALERLQALNFVNSQVYGYAPESPPAMNRAVANAEDANECLRFNKDFEDFLFALYDQNVAYLMVGDYAVVLHGYLRSTGVLDVWVKRSKENYQKLVKAFQHFGMATMDMTEEAFLHKHEFDVFTFGRPPVAIDLMTKVKGLDFDEAYQNADTLDFDGMEVRLISLEDLKKAKRASNRKKDQDDLEHLE